MSGAGTDFICVTRTTELGKYARVVHTSTVPRWGEEFPERTDVWCWFCCHPFDTKPLPLTVKYDPMRDTFSCTGVFCSFPCIKAFTRDYSKSISSRGTDAMAITLFRKRLTGKVGHIPTAPPRQMLKAFGGQMTIEEFRAKSEEGLEYEAMQPNMILAPQVFHERRMGEAKRKSDAVHHNLSDQVSLHSSGGGSITSESLKLKRAKPDAKKGSTMLERTLGLM